MTENVQLLLGVATFVILYTGTILGGAAWLQKQLKDLKTEIIKDFKEKHDENAKTVKAMETLVIRHDVILDPEFSRFAYVRKNNGSNSQ